MAMTFLLEAAALIAALGGSEDPASRPVVLVDQIADSVRPSPSARSDGTLGDPQAIRAAPLTDADGRTDFSPPACEPTEGGADVPLNPVCLEWMRSRAAAERSNPEGNLLDLFGYNSPTVQAPTSKALSTLSADDVARQGTSGGVPSSDAAAVASRQRSTPPPSSNPR
jgi:hypothetical protein